MKNLFINSQRKKSIKLQTKLFISFILTTGIVVFSLSALLYMYISPLLIKNEITTVKSLNNSFRDSINASIRDLDMISVNINYTSLILDDFKNYFTSNNEYSEFTNLLNLFIILNGSNLSADQINLYDFDGNVLRAGLVNSPTTVNLKELDWYEPTIALNGQKNISRPYKTSSYSSSNSFGNWYVSVYRTISNNNRQKIGFVETIKRCENIFKPILDYEKNETTTLNTYIFNKDGDLIYPYETKNDYSNYYVATKEQLDKNSDSVFLYFNKEMDQKEYLVYTMSNYNEWLYISVQPEHYILKPANTFLAFLIPITIIFLLISIAMSYFLSINAIKPINHLKEMILTLKLDNLGYNQKPTYKTYYELDSVYDNFEKMSVKLGQSMNELIHLREEELEAKNLALQAQINPHFYYNTLSSIIVLSENEQNSEVIKICKNLSQIMRYVTDNTSTIVTIKDELDYIEKYLYCMKVRYEDSLNIFIDIPDELLSVKIPKFIIQPLIENAIKYGIDTIPPWTIKIKGVITEEYWKIYITDTGNGFSEQTLKDLRQKFEISPENSDLHNLHLNGLGLINVHIRWKIFTKEKYIFEIKNTINNNGEVIIGMYLTK